MAIQHRRGVYDRFDPDKLRTGEWAVVLSGDSTSSDGMAVYMCFAAGIVKRMATFEDMVANIANANSEVVAQLTAGVNQVESAVEAAEALRVSAENGRVSAESARVSAEQGRATAESGRVTAENGRVTAETQRVARFAEIEQLANGWTIHHCTSGEYDATTRKPTVSNPSTGTLYCVPNADSSSGDAWIEWRYDSEEQDFEPVGSGEHVADNHFDHRLHRRRHRRDRYRCFADHGADVSLDEAESRVRCHHAPPHVAGKLKRSDDDREHGKSINCRERLVLFRGRLLPCRGKLHGRRW